MSQWSAIMLLTAAHQRARVNGDGAGNDWWHVEKAEFDTLRLLFMREGKLASAAWSLYETEAPAAVESQLDELDKLANALGELNVDQQEQLVGVFWATAKRGRPSFPDDEAVHALATAEVLARYQAAFTSLVDERQALLDSFLSPSDDAAAVVERMAAEPSEPVSYADILALYTDIGRVCAPLWISGTTDDFPDLPQLAVNVLSPIFATRMTPRRVFVESRSEFVDMSFEDCSQELVRAAVNSLTTWQARYTEQTPKHGALPLESTARQEEMTRRAESRAGIVNAAHQAVDAIVRPIHEGHAAWLARIEAEEEAEREQEKQAILEARALAGFERPEPQRYGVSARGAEFWVADMVRWLGGHDAQVTQQSSDGGVDVLTSQHAISVKHYAGSVPVEEIREIFGVAITLGKLPVLFTSGSLTTSAAEFAAFAPVAVIGYNVETAELVGLSEGGTRIVEQGLSSPPIAAA